MPDRKRFEVIIVGGGIAGASMAYFLAEKGLTNVLLFEREAQPGYHATGRSAATVVEWDPIPALQELKALGAAFLRKPPAGFSEERLLQQSGILVAFQEPAWTAVQQVVPLLESRGTSVRILSPSEALEIVPVLAPEHFDGGVFLSEDGFVDVHELLWSYLRHAARRGAERRCGVEVLGVGVENGRVCGVVTSDGNLEARWVVNASGAWAGKTGALARSLSRRCAGP
jgi:D-arginine dehydrogenase